MLTGTLAFKGESVADTIVAILELEPDLSLVPASTPRGVHLVVRRCLQKDVKRRLRDIADARTELDDALVQPAIADTSTLPNAQVRRSPVMAWGLLLLAGLATGIGLGWLAGRRREVAPPAFNQQSGCINLRLIEFGPAISPDGKWVASLSNARGPANARLGQVPRRRRSRQPDREHRHHGQTLDAIGGLAVSPDGSQIAFQAQSPGQLGGTWVIPRPWGALRRIMLPGRAVPGCSGRPMESASLT